MASLRSLRRSSSILRALHPTPFARPSGGPRRSFWSSSASTSTSSALPSLIFPDLPSISPDLLPLLIAVLLSSVDDEDPSTSPHPPWTVQSSSSGFGAFASRPLVLGELLIAERPLCIWPQGLSTSQAQTLFDGMTGEGQEAYLSLAGEGGKSGGPADRVRAIRATNGFGIELPGTGGRVVGMVFPRIARINHSCQPNAAQAMNFRNLRMEVYPITSIAPKTEICIEYLPLVTKSRAERQIALKLAFGFDQCLCPLCTASDAEITASDGRRAELRRLAQGVRSGRSDRKGTIEKLERMRTLLKEERYLGMPEFEDQGVSNAYAAYRTMKQREEAGAVERSGADRVIEPKLLEA